MKRNAIFRIIFFSLAIVVLAAILVAGIAAGQLMFRDERGDETISSSGEVSAAEIRNLDIDWAAGSITIRTADVSQITFTETCAEHQEPMAWKQAGDTLKIEYHQEVKLHLGNYASKSLLIELPRDWSCENLEIDAASADLEITDLTISKVEFDGASGQCRFENCQVEDLDLDTASGNVWFSGSLDTLECDAASADCDIMVSNHPRRIDMDAASGDLRLSLPADCGFSAELETLSGDFSSDFNTTMSGGRYVCGSGETIINVSALSGDVTIEMQ